MESSVTKRALRNEPRERIEKVTFQCRGYRGEDLDMVFEVGPKTELSTKYDV